MRLQNNTINFSKNTSPNFGMALRQAPSMQKLPEIEKINLSRFIDKNAAEISELTKNSDIFMSYDNTIYMSTMPKGFKEHLKCIRDFAMSKISEWTHNPLIMPKKSESLRLPLTENSVMNAIRKIT